MRKVPAGPDALVGHSSRASAVAFSPRGDVLATGGHDAIKLWDTATGRLRREWNGDIATSLAFTTDGTTLISASFMHSDQIRLWNPANGRLRTILYLTGSPVESLAIQPGGGLLASAGSDGSIRLWDIATGKPVRTLRGHIALNHQQVAFSPDGKLLASLSDDAKVRLWDVASGRALRALGSPSMLTAVGFSPDGTTLAATDELGTILIRDVATGALSPRSVRSDDDDQLRRLSFSPDGRTLATAGAMGTIRLWDPLTGQEMIRLNGHKARVNDLAFSPDGQTLASCSQDGMVRLWHARRP